MSICSNCRGMGNKINTKSRPIVWHDCSVCHKSGSLGNIGVATISISAAQQKVVSKAEKIHKKGG